MASPEDIVDNAGFERQKQMIQGEGEGDVDEFDEVKDKDDELTEKLNAIEKKIEEKLTLLDHTFGNVHQEIDGVHFVNCYFCTYICWN